MNKKSKNLWFRLLAVFIGISLAFAAIGLIELAVRMAKKTFLTNEVCSRVGLIQEGYYEKFFVPDPDLGYVPKPNVTMPCKKQYKDGRSIYDAHYTTDSFGRRQTPVDFPDKRDKFAVFFGCSFTFGDGLNDNETLPYFFARFAPCYMPYNYAFSGYGPQQMLAIIQKEALTKEIHEKSGIVFCLGAHVERAVGSYYVFIEWGRNFPYYVIGHNDALVRNGSFSTGRPLRSLMYRIMGTSELVRSLGLGHPFFITEEDRKLTARIVQTAFSEFKTQFQETDCYFVNPPGLESADPRNDRDSFMKVGDLLRKSGINVLDFSDSKEFSGDDYYIPGDGHPTALWNRQLAKMLVERLGLGQAQ